MTNYKIAVIVDAQEDFISGTLGNENAMKVANDIVKYIQRNSRLYDFILCTKDLHGENYLNTFEGKNLPIKHCIAGTSGSDIYKPIKNILSNYDYDELFTLNKSSFMASQLGESIMDFLIIPNVKEKDFEISFDVFGFDTDICVVSNALLLRRDFPESEIRCISNLCAGTTLENHEAALKVMKSCQIEVI